MFVQTHIHSYISITHNISLIPSIIHHTLFPSRFLYLVFDPTYFFFFQYLQLSIFINLLRSLAKKKRRKEKEGIAYLNLASLSHKAERKVVRRQPTRGRRFTTSSSLFVNFRSLVNVSTTLSLGTFFVFFGFVSCCFVIVCSNFYPTWFEVKQNVDINGLKKETCECNLSSPHLKYQPKHYDTGRKPVNVVLESGWSVMDPQRAI